MNTSQSVWARLVASFLGGNLAVLLIVVSLLAGAAALLLTPREEEPQIVVPLADVIVSYPGGTAEEVERLVAARLERLLYQIDGVEYVYSMSRPGQAVVTVRFRVGQDREKSLIKLYNKIFQNVDKVTPGIAGWVVKPVEIDDVPIVNVALYSATYDTHQLRRVAEEVVDKLQHIRDTSGITIHGGERRVVQVELDAARLAAHGLTPLEMAGALQAANRRMESGVVAQAGAAVRVTAGPFFRDAREVANLMVGAAGGHPVYLRDVARVTDGPETLTTYTRLGFGPGAAGGAAEAVPAVTIGVAKKKGSNAVWVARDVARTVAALRGTVIPDEVQTRFTRDYGATANEKVNSLVRGLLEAIVTVIVLIWLAMNWRVGLIVAVAVPITYGLTLLVNLLLGYTINRVTLFALILTLGLLVDDPIVGVENIYRHLGLRRQGRRQAIVDAMQEVVPPIVVATLAIVVAFLPLFFITGMMGPYMRPMAVNVPIAMLASMLVALTITPWISDKLLPREVGAGHGPDAGDVTGTRTYRVYRRLVEPLIASRRRAGLFLATVGGLFALSLGLALGVVPLKMLPFDNKNEFQLIVDMPEAAPLERTDAVVRELEEYLRGVPEVVDVTATVGAGSPMDFNGLVRHYYLRQGPHVADLRVNLRPKQARAASSHTIALRIRRDVTRIAAAGGANLKIVELPPGPPVLATVVAEVYGAAGTPYAALIDAAHGVADRLRRERGVVDVDVMVEDHQREWEFRVDREKAGLNGIATEDVVSTLRLAVGGLSAGAVHLPTEQNELALILQLPRADRSDLARLQTLPIKGRGGQIVQLGELGAFTAGVADKTIFHKNLERVVFVTADTAGRGPAYAVLGVEQTLRQHPLPPGIRADWAGEGEWKITLDVFRDLGIAFAAALLGIYVLLVYQTASFVMPLIVMLAIPLTLVGIMPGFALLNALTAKTVDGFADPVYFTATAMIGMIALAGIVVRNGIILIDFIQQAVARGTPLRAAILESGAVRFRPIFLTAGAAMLGAWPITLDPIFSGLAWSLIFGLFVSTAFTLVVIPVTYQLIYGRVQPRPVEEPT